MDVPGIHQRLVGRFGAAILGSDPATLDPWIEIAPGSVAEVCRFLRDEPYLRFEMLNLVTGVDYFDPDPKKLAAAEWQPHVEVLYHLSSLSCRHRLVVKVSLPRWKDDVEGQLPELQTVSTIWSTADWHEREVYDLFGVQFLGHPDLRRILLPDDWVGHPLRKGYRAPHEYHGIAKQA